MASIADPAQLLQHAVSLQQQGRIAEAADLYRQVLEAAPAQFDALHLLGVVRIQQNNAQEGVGLIERALQVNPNSIRALANHGIGLMALGRNEDALAAFDRSLALNPGQPDVLSHRGRALAEMGRDGDAIASFDKALALRPDNAAAITNRALALRRLGRNDDALAAFDRALSLVPGDVAALNGRGAVLAQLNRYSEALAAFDRALALSPDSIETLNHRGNVLTRTQSHRKALESYDRIIALQPNNALAHCNRGNALLHLNRVDEALATYDRALAIDPGLAAAWAGRANILQAIRRYEDAFAAADRALALSPDIPYLAGTRLHAKMHLCDWRDLESDVSRLLSKVGEGQRASLPFPLLAMPSSPAIQRRCSEICAADYYPEHASVLWTNERGERDRIRIAYISGDFRDHPMARLTAGLFRAHDRSRFEVIGVSFGPDTGDAMRRKLELSFDRFIDVRTRSDADVAGMLAGMQVDIAVDLSGFTTHARTNIFAMRPAPIQVNYLGYPGTMGAPYIDYIIADDVVIPPDHHRFYSENVVCLPDTYWVTDSSQPIAGQTPTRRQAGLPEDGFVFCAFNNAFKITPDVFDIWMSLLLEIDGGILWLIESNPTATANLRREAAARGVSPDRLVFAPRVDNEAHLARHRLADLFLDTFHYGAHTTASDALWAGLPVVTRPGDAFAGRVATSLLRAIGLPELVAQAAEEYRNLASKIARDPALLTAIKAKLAQNRMTHPLFDTARFTRSMESAYRTMCDIRKKGESPRSFTVAPD